MIHILVVDDDAALNQSICAYLNDSGYEAKGCLSAESAYDAMYNSLYEVIISDIMMPGTDGFDVPLSEERAWLGGSVQDDGAGG